MVRCTWFWRHPHRRGFPPLRLRAMNENCWDCIGPQHQHPFSFCGSELVIFKVYLIGRLARSISIALQITLKSHNSQHLEMNYYALWNAIKWFEHYLHCIVFDGCWPLSLIRFDGWPLPSISSCALGPWGSHTCGNPSRTDLSIQTLPSQPWYDHWSKPILNLLRAIISIVMA